MRLYTETAGINVLQRVTFYFSTVTAFLFDFCLNKEVESVLLLLLFLICTFTGETLVCTFATAACPYVIKASLHSCQSR